MKMWKFQVFVNYSGYSCGVQFERRCYHGRVMSWSYWINMDVSPVFWKLKTEKDWIKVRYIVSQKVVSFSFKKYSTYKNADSHWCNMCTCILGYIHWFYVFLLHKIIYVYLLYGLNWFGLINTNRTSERMHWIFPPYFWYFSITPVETWIPAAP